MVFGIWGGHLAGIATGNWSRADYISGIQMYMPPFYIWYAFLKNWSLTLDIVIILKTILLMIKGDQEAI